MPEENEGLSGKGVIPFFFYDVISFIIPGSYLLFGGFLIWFGQQWSESLYNYIALGGRQEGSIAALSVIAGVLFILFLGLSSFIGFLLSSLSYQTIEKLWKLVRPYSMCRLKMFVGIGEGRGKLEEIFGEMFGQALSEDNLDRASNLCAYYIWDHSPVLGSVTGRFDAEKIMSQSSILVGILLAALDLVHYVYALLVFSIADPSVFLSSLSGILVCTIACSFAFTFHREKRVYGRYQMFLLLVAKREHSKNQTSEGRSEGNQLPAAP
jgi:hypothetical protein